MLARGLAGVVVCSICTFAARSDAQAPSAQFPAETQSPPTPPQPVAAPPAPQASSDQAARAITTPAQPTTPTRTAQPTELAAPAAKSLAHWSLGAGIGIGFTGDAFAALGPAPVPTYEAALERRLGQRTWLALNARMSYDSRDVPGDFQADDTERPMHRTATTSLGGLLGLRYVFVEGVVDVSAFAGAFAAYHHVDGIHGGDGGLAGLSAAINSRVVGLLAGVAVERELVDALGLRLALDLATASFSRDQWLTINTAGEEGTSSAFSQRLGVSMRPSLQLHFYF
jgi:hypothetical protein